MITTYFFFDYESGRLKIGKTSQPVRRRLAKKCAETGVDLRLIGTIPNDVENALHRKFSHCRLRGEWFRAGDPQLADYLRVTFGFRQKNVATTTRRPPELLDTDCAASVEEIVGGVVQDPDWSALEDVLERAYWGEVRRSCRDDEGYLDEDEYEGDVDGSMSGFWDLCEDVEFGTTRSDWFGWRFEPGRIPGRATARHVLKLVFWKPANERALLDLEVDCLRAEDIGESYDLDCVGLDAYTVDRTSAECQPMAFTAAGDLERMIIVLKSPYGRRLARP